METLTNCPKLDKCIYKDHFDEVAEYLYKGYPVKRIDWNWYISINKENQLVIHSSNTSHSFMDFLGYFSKSGWVVLTDESARDLDILLTNSIKFNQVMEKAKELAEKDSSKSNE